MAFSDEQKLEIWKRSIDAQMHFAELSIKMRQIGLTLAGATIALAIVLYRTEAAYSFDIPFTYLSLPVGTILTLGAAGILFAAKRIDVDVYHKMLRGAVRFNELYEETMDSEVGWRSGLTEAISAYSRYEAPKLNNTRGENGMHWSASDRRRPAGNRINQFYWLCISALVAVAVALAIVENFRH